MKILFFLPTIINGSHVKIKKYVQIFKAKKVKVKTAVDSYLNIDGEMDKLHNETIFSIANRKLRVIANL